MNELTSKSIIKRVNGKSMGAGLVTLVLAKTCGSIVVSISAEVHRMPMDIRHYSSIFSNGARIGVGVNALKSQTFLTKRLYFNRIFNRFYPGSSKGMGHASKILAVLGNNRKPLSPAALIERNKMIYSKIIFLKFCDQFKQHTLAELLNDKFFIRMINNIIHGEPTLLSRHFQLALEVTYSGRKFNQQMIQEYFKNDFRIVDTFNTNQGLCDQSTLYTAMESKIVADYLNLSCDDIVVNSTPFFLSKNKITPEIKSVMETNKKLTDNDFPDVIIQERPYDFKDSKNFCGNKNQIYLLDVDNIKKHGASMLLWLEQSLRNQIETQSSVLSSEGKEYAKNISNILKDREGIPPQLLFDKLSKYVLVHQPPKDFRMPLVVPAKKAKVEELCEGISQKDLDSVALDPGRLTDVKAKKAIGSILDTYDPVLIKKVRKAIGGSLSHVLSSDNPTEIS